jgi:hypothetical protein
MSEDEYFLVKESINSKLKSHSGSRIIDKRPQGNDDNSHYPTRLVVPTTNFTLAFSKLGYIGINKMMDKAGVNNSRKTIIQASHLKTQIKSLNIKKDRHTIQPGY